MDYPTKNPSKIDATLESGIIWAQGDLTSILNVTDEVFHVDKNGLAISETMETYQWVEHEHTETRDEVGGG